MKVGGDGNRCFVHQCSFSCRFDIFAVQSFFFLKRAIGILYKITERVFNNFRNNFPSISMEMVIKWIMA